jgi:DNA-binding CsgD family transcriptional regulator
VELAAMLGITSYMVRDHLKAIFAKVGVHSRCR